MPRTTAEHCQLNTVQVVPPETQTSAASNQLTCHPHQDTWTSPFHRKMNSGFCVCAPSHSDCSIHRVIWGVFLNFTGNLGAHILYDHYFFRNTSTMKNLLQGKLQLQH